MHHFSDLRGQKHEFRAEAHNRRRRQSDRETLSRAIFARLYALPEYHTAANVLSYVSFRSEVSTHEFLAAAWRDGKRLFVPYCVADRLELFHLESLGDLAPGTLGIPEPRPALRTLAERHAAIEAIDLVITPGLAFDPHGGRVGYGRGYFDRLLASARAETAVVAVAFECQVFPAVPMLASDVRVDMVLTESNQYRRDGPRVMQ